MSPQSRRDGTPAVGYERSRCLPPAFSRTEEYRSGATQGAIRSQLDKLVRLNRTRADYLAKFEELIESYNACSRNIDELFKELLALSRSLNEEQERHVRENLWEE